MEKAKLFEAASKIKLQGVDHLTGVSAINSARKEMFELAGGAGESEIAEIYNSKYNLKN